MKGKRILAAFLALVMVLSTTTVIFAKDWSGQQTFDDVGKKNWYHGYVENLATQGIAKGYGKTDQYRPENSLSREEAAKMIAKAAGLTASPAFKSALLDLDDVADWALPYVYALEEAGVLKGFGDTNEFRPKQPIERGHIAKMLVKAFGLEKGPLEVKLTDLDLVEKDPEVLAAIRILASNGIVSGFGTSNKYRPLEDIDRAAFAKIIAIAQATATVQKAEKDDATPEEIAQAKKLVGNLPDVEDKDTKKSLEGRLDDLEKEEEPEPGPGPVTPQVSAISITTEPDVAKLLDNDAEVKVKLSTKTDGAVIYYTLDGSDPATSSAKEEYTAPFILTAGTTESKTITVRAIGVKLGYKDSEVAEKEIRFEPAEADTSAEAKAAFLDAAAAYESTEDAVYEYAFDKETKELKITFKAEKLAGEGEDVVVAAIKAVQDAAKDFITVMLDRGNASEVVATIGDDKAVTITEANEATVNQLAVAILGGKLDKVEEFLEGNDVTANFTLDVTTKDEVKFRVEGLTAEFTLDKPVIDKAAEAKAAFLDAAAAYESTEDAVYEYAFDKETKELKITFKAEKLAGEGEDVVVAAIKAVQDAAKDFITVMLDRGNASEVVATIGDDKAVTITEANEATVNQLAVAILGGKLDKVEEFLEGNDVTANFTLDVTTKDEVKFRVEGLTAEFTLDKPVIDKAAEAKAAFLDAAAAYESTEDAVYEYAFDKETKELKITFKAEKLAGEGEDVVVAAIKAVQDAAKDFITVMLDRGNASEVVATIGDDKAVTITEANEATVNQLAVAILGGKLDKVEEFLEGNDVTANFTLDVTTKDEVKFRVEGLTAEFTLDKPVIDKAAEAKAAFLDAAAAYESTEDAVYEYAFDKETKELKITFKAEKLAGEGEDVVVAAIKAVQDAAKDFITVMLDRGNASEVVATIGDDKAVTITEANEATVNQLAVAILGGKLDKVEEFLEGNDVTANFTLDVTTKDEVKFRVEGLTAEFTLDKPVIDKAAEAKAAFLDAAAAYESTEDAVYEYAFDKETKELKITFKAEKLAGEGEDVVVAAIKAVQDAAKDFITVMLDRGNASEVVATIGDDKAVTITEANEATVNQLAVAILGGKLDKVEEFLEGNDVTANFTLDVTTKDEVKFRVEGLTAEFTLDKPVIDKAAEAKAAFLDAAAAYESTEDAVYEYAFDKETKELKITFKAEKLAGEGEDVVVAAIKAVQDAAKDFITVMLDRGNASEVVATIGDDKAVTITEANEATVNQLAVAILGGKLDKVEEFLEGNDVTANFTLDVTTKDEVKFRVEGLTAEFTLDKPVIDKAAEAKAAFLDAAAAYESTEDAVYEYAFDKETKELKITFKAEKLAGEGEDVVVAAIKAVQDAAKDFITVMLDRGNASEVVATIGDDKAVTITEANEATVNQLAVAILGGKLDKVEEFLEGNDVTANFTLDVTTKDEVKFRVEGLTAEFTLDKPVIDKAAEAKAAFLDAAAAYESTEDAVYEYAFDKETKELKITFKAEKLAGEGEDVVVAAIKAVQDAAKDFITVMLDRGNASEVVATIGDDKAVTITEANEATVNQLAVAILGGKLDKVEEFLEGNDVTANFTLDVTTKDEVKFRVEGLTAEFTLDKPVMKDIVIDEDVTLTRNYGTVEIVGSNIEVDLGGYTALVLTIMGNNVALKNGTVINLTIAASVEDVTLENISDGQGGTHTFAGGGSSSIVFKGDTLLKGTVNITAPNPIQIRSELLNSGKGISGKVIVKTIRPVIIAAPVQGEIEVRAASESITIKSEVAKIVALTNAAIKIDQSIEEGKRPILEKAQGVQASAVIVDKDGEETDQTVEFEEKDDLTPAEVVIVSIANIETEVKVGDAFNLPTTVAVLMSDGTTRDLAVVWDPSIVDTSTADTFIFNGTVEGYDGSVKLVLTVKALPTTYTLTYTAGSNGSITGEAIQKVKHGSDGTAVTAIPNEGYYFVKWSDGFTDIRRIDKNVTADITVEATFAINEYTVTFKDWDGKELKSETVAHGSSATAPAVSTREGYIFTGWDVAFDNVIKELTVTAQYEAIDYTLTIKYKYTDGSEATGSYIVTLNIGDEYEVASPVITGYTADKETVSGIMPAGDATVAVVYTVNQYTITFDSAGGSKVPAITQDYGTAVIAPADPTKEGYTFDGWDPAVPETMPAEGLTLTAQWTINTYTVSFNVKGGSAVDSIENVEHNATVKLPEEPIREGYAFGGWFTDEGLMNPFTAETEVTADLTVYAKWIAQTHTVSFETNSESAIEDQTVNHVDIAIEPTVPEREGYIFAGWYADEELTTEFTFSTQIKEDITIYAKWEINAYTVTFDVTGGNGTLTASVGDEAIDSGAEVEHGKNVVFTATPNKGYQVKEWTVNEEVVTDNKTSELTIENISGRTTVTVEFESEEYTVTVTAENGTVTGSGAYRVGDEVTLEATADACYEFKNWVDENGNEVSTENTYIFTMGNSALNLTANFVKTGSSLILDYDENEGTVVGTVNGDDIGEDGNALPLDAKIELTATPSEGYTFVGWRAGGNEIISYDDTYTFSLSEDITVVPLFYLKSEADIARIGATGYETLEEALVDAMAGDIVILLQDYTLTEDVTVPDDVLLLLPCGPEDYTGYTDTGFNPDGTSTSKSDLSVLYKTLTVPEGVAVTIEGTVMVNAVTGRPAGGYTVQDITGGYSQIILEGNMCVVEGGLLDNFGEIDGAGMIEALDGGSIGDLYVVQNWRGGSQALGCAKANVFPFNQYDLHNIKPDLKIRAGASYYGNVKMYETALRNDYHYTRFYQFDQTRGLIRLEPGSYVLKTYDELDGRTTLAIHGGAQEIGGSMEIAGLIVSTKGYLFPIDGHIDFILEHGEYNINNRLKFLTGTSLFVSENATLTVKPDASLVLYEEFHDAPNTSTTQYPDREPVELVLEGTLQVEGAFGGLINAGENAKVVIADNAILSVTSKEANGYGTGQFNEYILTTNLAMDYDSVEGWYYYQNGEDINSAVAVPIKPNDIDYINLNLDPDAYRGYTFVIDEVVITNAERVSNAKEILESGITWDTDLETTLSTATSFIEGTKLPPGVIAVAKIGAGEDDGQVVITITCGEEIDTLVIEAPLIVTHVGMKVGDDYVLIEYDQWEHATTQLEGPVFAYLFATFLETQNKDDIPKTVTVASGTKLVDYPKFKELATSLLKELGPELAHSYAITQLPALPMEEIAHYLVLKSFDESGEPILEPLFEHEAPIVEAEIETVTAENGKVTITLKAKPTKAPSAEDFSATIAIDGGEATALTLSDFAIDEDGVTITFNFEAVEQTDAEQSVVIVVTLGEGDGVAAEAFRVSADPLADEKAAAALIDGKSVEVEFGKGEDAAAVLAAIKALETENTIIQGLAEADIAIAEGKATVTFAEGVTAEVTVNVAANPTEAAKQEFLDAVTAHNPESDIYEYSFDGANLNITFDFTKYVDYKGDGGPTINILPVIEGVMEAAGEFLTAIFVKGNAQQIVINMNNQEVTIDSNSTQNEIIELAGAVFDVDASGGKCGALMDPVANFLGLGEKPTPIVTADFTMTVTNQDGIEFTLDGLTATFANVTE